MTKLLTIIFALLFSNGLYGGLTALIVFGVNEIFGKSYGYAIPLTVVCALVTLYILFQALVITAAERRIDKEFGRFTKGGR